MKWKAKTTIIFLCMFVMLAGSQVLAESKSGQKAIEIYPPHAPPTDMTWAEQALHRRATEIAIWAMPLMNYKAMYAISLTKTRPPMLR